MTLENWDTLMNLALLTNTNNVITMVYFIVWIFTGNYILLNLVLAVLLDGIKNIFLFKNLCYF
jgi:hypothetical protein